MAKQSKRGSSVRFISNKSISYEITGPSGRTYQFDRDKGTLVDDSLDISSFMSNPHLSVKGSVLDDRPIIKESKVNKPQSFKIKNLLSEEQLDYMNIVGSR